MKLQGYDKYQKVKFELESGDTDEIYFDNWFQNSKGTGGTLPVFFSSPDKEDYEPGRWSDLEFKEINNDIPQN